MTTENKIELLIDPERVEPVNILNQPPPAPREPLIAVDGLRFRTWRRRPDFVTALRFDGTRKMAETIVKVVPRAEVAPVLEGTSVETWMVRLHHLGLTSIVRAGDYIVIGRDGVPWQFDGEAFETQYQTGEID